MAVEIERKFLLRSDSWRPLVTTSTRLVQGYLIDADVVQAGVGTRCSMRVRIGGDKAWLNIKSANLGVARQEYEYPIPVADAERMLADFCHGAVEKVRHYVVRGGLTFEVDEFLGDNAGLLVAELELDSVAQAFERPDWLGREVTERLRYYNLNLLRYPYSLWNDSERAGD